MCAVCLYVCDLLCVCMCVMCVSVYIHTHKHAHTSSHTHTHTHTHTQDSVTRSRFTRVHTIHTNGIGNALGLEVLLPFTVPPLTPRSALNCSALTCSTLNCPSPYHSFRPFVRNRTVSLCTIPQVGVLLASLANGVPIVLNDPQCLHVLVET